LPAKIANCSTINRASPSRSRISAIWAALALSPAMIAAGSPRRQAQHHPHRHGGENAAGDER